MARPTKLTPEVQEKLCDAIAAGNYREVAAQWVGIAPETFSRWMARGDRQPRSIYGAFRQAVIAAEQRAEIRAVGLIMAAAKDDPRHAEWWLERKFPARWGRKDRHVIETPAPGDGEFVVRFVGFPNDPGPAPGTAAA